MEPEFWHERWRENRIGFHTENVHPALVKLWSQVAGFDRSAVLVPLCGKSLDLHWLAESGHPVVGVELSPLAIEQFFEESGFRPTRTSYGGLPAWSVGPLCLVEGDFFEFSPPQRFGLCYDRAALIALPANARARYLAHLAALLKPEAAGLLITLEYNPTEMDGPPFAACESELRGCTELDFDLLQREDVLESEPRFKSRGVQQLHEAAWRMKRRAPSRRIEISAATIAGV